mgnify:CR=1 FL=1
MPVSRERFTEIRKKGWMKKLNREIVAKWQRNALYLEYDNGKLLVMQSPTAKVLYKLLHPMFNR